jgi:ketosteroid isomerase-like protein
MSSMKLAHAVAGYIAAANAQDINAVTACFTEDAVVFDEKQERRGISAIRIWAEMVSKKYRPTLAVLDVTHAGGTTVIAGRVSGDFPNSPVQLRYASLGWRKIRAWRSRDGSASAPVDPASSASGFS